MTSLTDTQVVTASGGLVELGYGTPSSSGYISITQTAPATGTEIAQVTVVCDGSPILVEFSAANVTPPQTSGDYILFSLEMDGSIESTYWGLLYAQASNFGYQPVHVQRRLSPSAGSHTFRVRATVPNAARAGTVFSQTGGVGNAAPAFLRVSKIVQATQWPAVTTGTIICTSTTRPASPFEGQKIYQTDDNRELTYDSSAWVQTNSLGGWSTWTPQLYQNGNLTSTIPHARYTRIGDTAIVQGRLNATQAGTAGQQMEVRNLPYPTEAAGRYIVIGNAVYWDGTLRWLLHVETLPTATSIAFGYDSAPFAAYGGGRFGQSPSKAVASGHFISFATTYEIA
jgi:hypothetical protein